MDFFNKSFNTLDAVDDFILNFNCFPRETISNNQITNNFIKFTAK